MKKRIIAFFTILVVTGNLMANEQISSRDGCATAAFYGSSTLATMYDLSIEQEIALYNMLYEQCTIQNQ